MIKDINSEVKLFQNDLLTRFQLIIDNKRLSHAYLFSGANGSGKETLAMWIAMRLFCTNLQSGFPCCECNECTKILLHNHPDVIFLDPNDDNIKVDQIRLLKKEANLSSVEGRKKIFIINNAELLTNSASNSLLKFIEEPAKNTYIILLTNNLNVILPTIISRTQVVFMKLNNEVDQIKKFTKMGLSKDLSKSAVKLTQDSTCVLNEFIPNDWFNELVNLTKIWFLKLLNKDLASFNLIAQFLSLNENKTKQKIILDTLVLPFRDILFKKLNINGVCFLETNVDINKFVKTYTVSDMLNFVNIVFNAKRFINNNISLQNIIEYITVKILNDVIH